MAAGLLLVNLGTPDAPTPPAVRRYLREFLSDPRVITLPAPARWLLLELFILPFRPAKSAHAYQQIWTERGSPLLVHSVDLTARVAQLLGSEWRVSLGMRYGNPTISSALQSLVDAGVDTIFVLPLFPQFATSTTESAIVAVREAAARTCPTLPLTFLPPFFDAQGFLDAFAKVARPVLAQLEADHLLFSFHGLPTSHLTAVEPSCLSRPDCCSVLEDRNRNCYRAQCYVTARLLAQRLGLDESRYSVSFQSRLSSRWIEPFSDTMVTELAARGVRRLAVVCPAFVSDCLETLEEIGLRLRDTFLAHGGERFQVVPCLNSDEAWAEAVASLARHSLSATAVTSP